MDFNKRSLYSMLIYLNTCESGGSTRIFAKSDANPSSEFVTDSGGRYRYDEAKFVDQASVRDGTGGSHVAQNPLMPQNFGLYTRLVYGPIATN